MAESARNFIITQFGLSCFEAVGPNHYIARTFNFWVFPDTSIYKPKFMCEAGSIDFLCQQGFDFNMCFKRGVPYMPIRMRDWHLSKVRRIVWVVGDLGHRG